MTPSYILACTHLNFNVNYNFNSVHTLKVGKVKNFVMKLIFKCEKKLAYISVKAYPCYFSFSCITTGKECLESTEVFDDGSSMLPALSPPEDICEIPCSSTAIATTSEHANKFSHDLNSSTPNVHKDSSINEDELCHSFLTSHSDEPCNVSCPETADSPSLLIESENSVKPQSFPSGRVICDIGYVITQARKLEDHNHTCNFNGRLIYKSHLTRGLVHTYTFECDKVLCSHKKTVVTDGEQGCLNKLAVLGAMSTGNGYSQEEQKFSIMNMTYMSKNTFANSEKAAGDGIEVYSKDTMDAAIDEEKKLAKEGCNVDRDGFYNVCAIVDGGWCKRSYGHGYNASSGVAVIIGALTKKILYIGVRNKVCLICRAIEDGRTPSKDHMCSKNWTGPSTAMESDIIVEGLKYLEKVHSIRCTRLIGDGDTNLMTKVQENVSFGCRILKIECANHAVRRYFRALERIQKNTSKFHGAKGILARKILQQRMSRLILSARKAIKDNAVHNLQEPELDKVAKLAAEILNGPAHVFGKHDSCGNFCSRKESDPDPCVHEIMTDTGMFSAIMDEIRRTLVSCCNTLIFNCTNNPAENYMSQFCKAIGGKRIDFSKGNSIKRRANIAAVAFQNPAQKWQHNALKALTGRSPGTPHSKFIAKRLKCHIKRLNRRKLFVRYRRKREHVARGGDNSYGDQPDLPDLDASIVQLKTLEHMSSIAVKSRDELEELTRGQASCERWRYERSKRIPSSLFKDVAGRRSTTLCANLVKRIIYSEKISVKAMEYGNANEPVAVKEYEVQKGVAVKRCGMFVDPEYPFLCTSPDGLIGEDGLLEVKCPFSAKSYNSLIEVVEAKHDIGIKLKENKFYLPSTHKYYYQIQGQLAITNREWCDLFVWSPKDTKIIHIQRDGNFWENNVPKLQQFYEKCCVPEITDPRVPRKKAIREPEYILEAIRQKQETQTRNTNRKQKAKPSKATKKNDHQIPVCYDDDVMDIEYMNDDDFIDMDSMNEIVEHSLPNTVKATQFFSPKSKRLKKPKIIFDL